MLWHFFSHIYTHKSFDFEQKLMQHATTELLILNVSIMYIVTPLPLDWDLNNTAPLMVSEVRRTEVADVVGAVNISPWGMEMDAVSMPTRK